MRNPLILVLSASLILGGCAGARTSALNPFNWFGRAQPVPTAQDAATEVNPLIPRRGRVTLINGRRQGGDGPDLSTPITTVKDVRVERVPGGAIIRATGIDPVQGIFNAKLVPDIEDELPVDGVLSYRLQRETARGPQTGTPATREIVVARHVTDQTLAGVRTIRVSAEQNALQVRR